MHNADPEDMDLELDLEQEPDPPAPEAAGDPAAEAFARLEGELALMRRAVQHLAAERADIVIPDYGSTLTAMAKRLSEIDQCMEDMADHPAMQMTPDSIGNRIAAAADSARRSDHDRIAQARNDLHHAAQEMRSVTAHARTAAEQRQQLYQVAQAEHCWQVSCYGLSFPAPLPAPCPNDGTGPSAWPHVWSAKTRLGARAKE